MPDSDENPQRASRERISDPERIRALAHPVRLALLDYLADVREATATECADAIGESPASCSFHLRTLEKYGYIERAPRRGREKPWRPLTADFDMRPDADIPGSLHAVQAMAALGLQADFARAQAYFAQVDKEADAWVQASTFTRSSFWATVEELAELSREVQNLTDRFAGRHADPALRPPGSRPSRMLALVNPDPITPAPTASTPNAPEGTE